MSDNSSFGFGKFVPGFDFLQNLAGSAVKGAGGSIPQIPNLSNWVAPTLSVEELDKRIDELKSVQFWLDQNAAALKATIQALEVQKMTLATLKGMNFQFADVANAFKLKAGEMIAAVPGMGAAAAVASTPPKAAPQEPTAAPAGVVDPMQWWGALTQQFQQIAANAMKDAAKQTAMDTTRNLATGLAKEALKTAVDMAGSIGKKAPTPATASKKVATKRPATRTTAKKVVKKPSSSA